LFFSALQRLAIIFSNSPVKSAETVTRALTEKKSGSYQSAAEPLIARSAELATASSSIGEHGAGREEVTSDKRLSEKPKAEMLKG